MKLGALTFTAAEKQLALVARPTAEAIQKVQLSGVLVAEINPVLSDTATFCAHYKIGLDITANCVIVEAKRADKTWYAACLVLGTARADINGVIRKRLGARKVSFAPMELATSLTGMEYGGITPLGLPEDWPILVDTQVARTPSVLIGSGLRKSKVVIPRELLRALPHAEVLDISQQPN